MAEQFYMKQLPNGLMLLGQKMDGVSSAAMSFYIQAGAAHDPGDAEGAASVASEWMLRGAGDRDIRQLNDALDGLGCQHDESVQSDHIHFSTAQLGRNLDQVLAIYADVLRRPTLAESHFEPCRQLIAQDIASLEDEPARKCNILLREKFYPYPLGRCVYGHAESLAAMTPAAVRRHTDQYLTPCNGILSIAGNIDWDGFVRLVERHFGDWETLVTPAVQTMSMPPGETHIRKDTAQTHIAIAHKSVTIRDERYYAARIAETVLSGGMSGRLFTEVREKRGLVYGVGCRYHSLKDHAGLFTYAGTRPEVAQQTFDVTVGELRRLAEGISEDEMARARTQLKSSLIMQGESTGARSSAIASDYYHLGRLRGLQEIADAIDAVTVAAVLEYLRAYPPENLSVLVVGPEKLKIK